LSRQPDKKCYLNEKGKIRKYNSKGVPFHFLLGSMERALRTTDKLARPQYAGSDWVWKYDISLKKPSMVPL
jgi:hypothetical protein